MIMIMIMIVNVITVMKTNCKTTGEYIANKRQIASRYVSSALFWSDLMSLIPMICELGLFGRRIGHYIGLLRLLRVPRVVSFLSRVETFEYTNLKRLFQLVCLFV
jgi:hypothetical protein